MHTVGIQNIADFRGVASVMDQSQKILQAWITDIITTKNWTNTDLARKAGLTPSTLTRFMKPDFYGSLNATTIAKIARAAKVPVPQTLGTDNGDLSGFSELDAVPLKLTPSPLDSPTIQTWSMLSTKLQLAGILPGDELWADSTLTAEDGDTVVAQVYDDTSGTAVTVIRLLRNNHLITASANPNDFESDNLQDRSTKIMAVVYKTVRERKPKN